MNTPITKGIHHLGLTVSNLEQSADFFTSILGWIEVRRNDDYPSIFITDNTNMITLWKAKDNGINTFNKDKNVGLHHVALKVLNESDLFDIHNALLNHNIEIEFSPELLRDGPAKHMMCIEPSGIRVEFIWPGI